MMASIVAISAKDLFGQFDYRISPPFRSEDDKKAFLLYGENGAGKSTILRLVFHLMGASDGFGHKTFLANCRFRHFEIQFADDSLIRATRDGDADIGRYLLTYISSLGERVCAQIGVDSERNVTNATCPELPAFLAKIKELKLSLYYISEDRQLEIDSPQGKYRTRRDKTLERSSMAEADYVRSASATDLNPSRIANILLQRSIRSASDWLRYQAIQAVGTGDTNVNAIYLDILRKLTMSHGASSSIESTDRLIQRLTSLLNRSAEYSKFGLIPQVDASSWIELLGRIKPQQKKTLTQILTPYVDSLEARLEALAAVQASTSIFIQTLNGFLTRKVVSFDPGLGLRIHSSKEEELPPEILSSGERQLILLFCNVLVSGQNPAIYIIDEPELSLNVMWQRRLLSALVDTDYELHIPCRKVIDLVAFTDFGSMEIYFFEQKLIQRLLSVTLKLKTVDAKSLLADLTEILVFQYFARLTALKRGWGMLDADIVRHLVFTGDSVALNKASYSLHALTQAHQAAALKSFEANVTKEIADWNDDPRKIMRGHDFSVLLYEFCRKKKARHNPFSSYEGLESCLALAFPRDALKAYPLFQRIERFVQNAA